MLTFFRRIRKGLLGEGAVPKYLLYAIGEVLLVMIGILLALQVNNWNENRKVQEFESKLLQEIHSSLLGNIEIVKRGIFFNELARASCQIVIEHLELDLPYADSLDLHFSRSLFWYKVSANNSAFETAKSYGLHIVTSDSIRSRLSSIFEGNLELIAAFERRNHDFFYHSIISVTRDIFESTSHGILMPPNFTYMGSMKPTDYDDLKIQHRYLHILKTLVLNRSTDITFLNRLLREMKGLDEMIRQDLDFDK